MKHITLILAASSFLSAVAAAGQGQPARETVTPDAKDDRLVVELVAEHPQIVTPTGLAVDARGRIFVAESHTHFRPDDYDGPETDQIVILVDRDHDGRTDQRHVFHQGFTHVMDLAFHPDGSLYVATRMDIHRLRDSNGDDRADEVTRIVHLETTGTYPHNGLSGLAFDFFDQLNFGLGENLGHAYTLRGSDGRALSGGGEGGSTYRVDAEGRGLVRTSTGWWNPFGLCVDAFGRVFGTDNDPGASPPCRLIQLWDGGDYGYEYRYGRTGLHPLITWTGDLPGTIPMVAGTGEAPCGIVAYEGQNLPAPYRGQLLVPCWADHRIEAFQINPADENESTTAEQAAVRVRRDILVEGGNEFRPVDLAVAPDGTIYFSDWVSASYSLHRLGRVWRIRARDRNSEPVSPAATLSDSTARQWLSDRGLVGRETREAAARHLAATAAGREQLSKLLTEHEDPTVRVTCLHALRLAGSTPFTMFRDIALHDRSEEVRAVAARYAAERYWAGDPSGPWDGLGIAWQQLPACTQAWLLTHHLQSLADDHIDAALGSSDPVAVQAAVQGLAAEASQDERWQEILSRYPAQRLMVVRRRSALRPTMPDTLPALDVRTRQALRDGLDSSDPAVRLLAIKWVADEQLTDFRDQVQQCLSTDDLDYRSFLAIFAALERLDGREPRDRPHTKELLALLDPSKASSAVRGWALRLLDPRDEAVELGRIIPWVGHADPVLRREATWLLAQHHDARRVKWLAELARNGEHPSWQRAIAILGLAFDAERQRPLLVQLAQDEDEDVAREALRALLGTALDEASRESLATLGSNRPKLQPEVQRLLNTPEPQAKPRDSEQKTEDDPPSNSSATAASPALAEASTPDIQAWLNRAQSQLGDASRGERIFFHGKIGTCGQCHTVQGRGVDVGPELTRIRQRLEALGEGGQAWLLGTILQPSREMAPQYTPWRIVTTDGRVLTGLPRRKGGDAEAYLGLDGREFTVRKSEIEFHQEVAVSVMPTDLLKQLTPQELSDLLAFLSKP